MVEQQSGFIVRQNSSGSWDVIAVGSGLPATSKHGMKLLENLSAEDASELLKLMQLWERHDLRLAKRKDNF